MNKWYERRIEEAIQKFYLEEGLPEVGQSMTYDRHIDEIIGYRPKVRPWELVNMTLHTYQRLKPKIENRPDLMLRVVFYLIRAYELQTRKPIDDDLFGGTVLTPPNVYLKSREMLKYANHVEHYALPLPTDFFDFEGLTQDDFIYYYTQKHSDDPDEGPLYSRFVIVDYLPELKPSAKTVY